MIRGLALAWVLALAALAARAHEVRPAYLELTQRGEDTLDVLWKVPGRGGEYRLGLDVEFPPGTEVVGLRRTVPAPDAFVDRWTVRRPGGFAGQSLRIAGLSATMTDVLVRRVLPGGSSEVDRLTPADPSCELGGVPRPGAVAWTYWVLGVEHILLGLDHLLFVLALLLLVGRRWGPLLQTITAFTVAHSITLGLAALGAVHVPSAPVEAVIALSIMFVASEVLQERRGRPGLARRAPWLVAFSFGLLHGFGFAGALGEIGLPGGHIVLALFLFNLGVEAGQIVFVALMAGLLAVVRRLGEDRSRRIHTVLSYCIGAMAACWFIQRTASLVAPDTRSVLPVHQGMQP